MLGLPFQLSSKQAFATFTTFCNCFCEYSKGNTYDRKKISQIPRTWRAWFSSAIIGFFLRQSSLVDYQQLWFYFFIQKMTRPPRVWSSSSYTPKTTIAMASNSKFQTYKHIVCRAKKNNNHMYERIRKRMRGRGIAKYLRKPQSQCKSGWSRCEP
jgi:hypothetical protein